VRRRKVLAGLTGVAVWPHLVRAQQSGPVVGFLNSRSPRDAAADVAGFREGLAERGYVEGQNVTIEYRWAEGRFDRLPGFAAELVSRRVAAIAATGGEPSAFAARAASSTIPIVFIIGGDPVEAGLVPSLNRPGGNLTGVALLLTAMEEKRLSLLRELLPAATLFAVLLNAAMPTFDTQLNHIGEAARAVGKRMHLLRVRNDEEIDAAFASAAEMQAGALLVGTDPFMISRRDRIVALAARYAIPAMYPAREYVIAGGLMSYGSSIAAAYRQAGVYMGRILKGEKPADLPVEQSSKFEFVINLKTAKALGIEVPNSFLVQATEIIE
jgi:putative ABC transport system substrate-binding protein